MQPTDKTEAMWKFSDHMASALFGRDIDVRACIQSDTCVCCGSKVTRLAASWSELDRKEFTISGMCPRCTDFGP